MISLKHDEDKSLLLSQSYLLRRNSQYSNVFMAPDRTKYEREKHKKLVEELKERHLQGAKDLVIRNGVIISKHSHPTIVSPLPIVEEFPFSLPDDIPNKDEINLAIANFCAVTNKQSELVTFVNLHDIDILCGTESHLDETILSSEIFPQNFNIFRKDRNIHGDGVFAMVKNTLLSSQVDIGVSCEIIWTCIHNKAAQILIVGSFYCPPQSPISVLEELAKSITYIKTEYPSSKVILAGDFNSPGIDWRNGCLTDSYVSRSFMNSLLIYRLTIFLNKLSRNRLEEGIYWIYALLPIQTKLSSVIHYLASVIMRQ